MARRWNLATHRRYMVRMAGLGYGVLPCKQIYVTLLSLTWLPGGACLPLTEGVRCGMFPWTALPLGQARLCVCVSTGMHAPAQAQRPDTTV